MADPPGLVRRGNVWMIRVRVPDRVRPIIKKREITKSLKTTSHREARLLAWDELRAVAHSIEQAEIALGLAQQRPFFPPAAIALSDAQIKEAVRSFLGELEATAPAIPFDPDEQATCKANADEEAYQFSRDAALEDAGLQNMASAFASRLGVGFPDGDAFLKFCDGIRHAVVEHALRQSAQLGGAPVAFVNPVFAGVVPSVGPQNDSIPLAEAIQRYIDAPSRASNVAKTQEMYRLRLGTLRDLVGAQRLVCSITRADMTDYLGQLIKLPANAGQRFKGVAAVDAIAMAEEQGAKTLSKKTVKLYFDAARSLFGWLERQELIDRNPTVGIEVPRLSMAPARRPYRPAEMQSLLNATPRDGPKEWAYWCARIAMLQGFRLTEPLGFRVCDLIDQKGVWIWRVHPNESRTVKTAATVREVPVHPKLIELGILRLKEGRKEDDPLLPNVPRGTGKQPFGPAQKQLGRIVRQHVSKDKLLVFHSLRHSFVDEARGCGLPERVIERLGGWAGSKKSAMDGYGSGHRLPNLRDWLGKMVFDGVTIS